MPKLRIDLVITCDTALSVGAGGSSGSLADKSIMRDGWGRPLIPGSQVKGKIRHASEALLAQLGKAVPAHFNDDTDTLIRQIFGSPKYRSPLRFCDLIGLPEGEDRANPVIAARSLVSIRPSVSINRQRGTAEDARLFFQEMALDGLIYVATPAIYGEVNDPRHAALLWVALRLSTRWGGGSTRGLGWATVKPTLWVDDVEHKDEALSDDLRALLAQGGSHAA